MSTRNLLISAMALLVAGAAQAMGTMPESMSKQDLSAYETQFNKDMADGKRYAEITQDEVKTVKEKFAAIDARWNHADSAGNLNPNDVSAMTEDLAAIDRVLHHAALESRLVCSDGAELGTRISSRHCTTQAALERQQKNSLETMRELQSPTAQNKLGN